MPLLAPRPPERHECAPPRYKVRPPTGPAGSSTSDGAPAGIPKRLPVELAPPEYSGPTHLPAIGSTWDCPGCGTVWIVREGLAPHRRNNRARMSVWSPARRSEAREHEQRLLPADHPSAIPPGPPPPPPPPPPPVHVSREPDLRGFGCGLFLVLGIVVLLVVLGVLS